MKNFDSINPQTQTPLKPPGQKVNLLSKNSKIPRPKRILKTVLSLLIVVILVLGVSVVLRAVDLSNKIFVGNKISFFQKIVQVFGGSQVRLTGEDLGQINILLLGIGGQGHDGPYLSDTMILAQIRPDSGAIALTSIPRDYWADIPGLNSRAKINEAFSDGYLQNHDYNQGGQMAIKTVENLTGLTVPYFAVVDFSGFEKAVDQIGGLDIKVDTGFTDNTFPNDATYGYLPPQTFAAGWQHMDGSRALIFARSRHAEGLEGGDFARSARQQKVIQAFKEKVVNLNLITDAGKINSLINIFADHFHTNLSPSEIFRVYSLAKDKNINKFLSLSLDPVTGLICPEILAESGAYVLTPCPGKSEEDIQNFFKNAFSVGQLNAEKSIVWLADSTGNKTAYDTAYRHLTDAGLVVYQLSYTKDNLPQTLVYQLNPKPATAEFIKNDLHATEVTLPPPGVTLDKTRVDVVVVLGQNAPQESAPKPYIPPPARIPTSTPATSTPVASTIITTSTPVKISTSTKAIIKKK
jgi:LCP family protein required for cell wall assembly